MQEQRVRIAPSILSADMAALGRDLGRVSNADLVHFDVMDGHFTQNLTFGPAVLKACKRSTNLPFDVHMMVSNPDESVDWYVDAGANIVTVHYEAALHLHRIVAHLHDRGVRAGVALNPATPVGVLEDILPDLDLVLVMSVNPGFGGQSFIPNTLPKLRRLQAMCDAAGASPLIEVDGGISSTTIEDAAAAGADTFVAGSAIFGANDPSAEVARLRELGDRGLSQRNGAR